jgi:hypothetical protein
LIGEDMSKHTFKVKAATALTQFQVVKFDAGELIPGAAATDVPVGIVEDGAEGGELRSVVMAGITKARVNGSGTAIVMGDELTCGAGGLLVKHAGTAAHIVVGTALQGSTGNGDLIDVLIFDHKKPHRSEPA